MVVALALAVFCDAKAMSRADAPQVPIAARLHRLPACGPQILDVTRRVDDVVAVAARWATRSRTAATRQPRLRARPRAALVVTVCPALPEVVVAGAFPPLAPGFMN